MKKKLIFLVFILITSVWFGEGCGGDAAVSIPDIPQGVDATASGDTVAVTWDEVDGATSYNIYWSTTAGVTKDNGTKIEEVTSPYEHEGLTYGEAYYYVVTAVNDAGESDVSEEVFASIEIPISIPGAPQGVDATASGDTVTVTWDEVDGATSYNIYWSTTAGVTKDNGTKIEEVTSPYEHEGLTYGEAYYYVVTAVNDAGESDVSEEVSVTIAYPVPAAPSDVAAESDGSTVTVTWDAANYATSYNIYWRTSTGVTKANGTKISGVTSPYEHTGRAAGESYYYIVTATNGSGEGDASAQAFATIIPGAPQNVSAVADDNDITVTWDAVNGATSYNIYWRTSTGVTKANGTKITGVTSPYDHNDLPEEETYYYVVTAVNSAGESIVSNEDSAYSDYPLLKMFVTSATGTGDLSSWDIDGWSPTEEGMAAGDEICQHLATEAGLAGTFKAWLSDSTTDAYCHIHNLTGQKVANCGEDSLPVTAGPWVRTDGQPFSEKIDQTLSPNYKIYTSPMYDELGNKIVTSYAFTGSSAAGTLDAYPNCLDWSSHDGGTNGAAGNTDRTGAFWTLGLYNACNSLNGIYCFQVDQGRALPPFASDGKKVFVTSVTGTGDLGGWPQSDGETGLLAGDAICNSLADDASLTGTFVSWISDDTTDAKDRITSDGPWVRLDGMLVAEDKAGLVSGELNAPVNQDEYGSYLGVQGVSPDVWTGTNEFGVVFAVGVTCSDWADGSDGVSSFYGKLVSSSGSWTKDSSVTCDGSRRLYCFEN